MPRKTPELTAGAGSAMFLPDVANRPKPPTAPASVPVFPIACWALGVLAFAELLVAGLALAARLESSRQVQVVEKEVIKVVAVPTPPRSAGLANAVVTHPPLPAAETPIPAAATLPPPTPLQTPAVADPRTEQLLLEARQARVAGDMVLAIVKLEEAGGRSPNEPSVSYELGLVHEQMGVYDTATDYYQKVAQLGVAGAGVLYEKAMAKLRDGFVPDVTVGKMGLGTVQVFNDPNHEGGQQVILSIPIQKAPGVEIELKDLSVMVEFFNRSSRDGIVPREEKDQYTEEWPSAPVDWADGEETARIIYDVSRQDEATEHLFGEVEYYGQVVSLLYAGEVLDVQARPPSLAAKSRLRTPDPQPQAPALLDNNNLPLDFDPNLPMVLPPR